MQPRFLALSLSIFCLLPAQAEAQETIYRPNVPGVLRPVPAGGEDQNPEAILAAFAKAYAAAGKPRMALYWNRALGDAPSTAYRRFWQMDQVTIGQSAAPPLLTMSQVAQSETAVPQKEQAEILEGAQAFRVESLFTSQLLDAGAILLDRATLVRLTAMQKKSDVKNLQALEMEALRDKADILISILQSDDPQSPIGAALQVKVIEVASGRILAHIAAEQISKRAASVRFAAAGYGFEKQELAAAAPDGKAIGKALAYATMEALTRSLR